MRWALLLALCGVWACGDDDGMVDPDAGVDAPMEDGGPDAMILRPNLDHCDYEPPPATANASGMVESGALMAGASEVVWRPRVGSALGAYTARVDFLGDIDPPDRRFNEVSGTFAPSVGVETWPRVKAVSLQAGGETVILMKVDIALADEVIGHRVAQALEESRGQSFAGKILFATSHSHSAFSQYTSNQLLWVGLGRLRNQVSDGLVAAMVQAAEEALDSAVPAQLGFAVDPNFDPEDRVTRDRRSENDEIAGGSFKDNWLFVMRVDTVDGSPIAIVPVFGTHATILDADNLLASTDAVGAIERAIEESFDERVVAMHLQGAGGDVSPAGSGGIRCDGPCYNFARAEMVGRNARDLILAQWTAAGDALESDVALEMLTRHIELGPDPSVFTVRDGELRYADDWDGITLADGEILDPMGGIISPLDEFNAPFGAALCGEEGGALFPMGQLPGTRHFVNPYRSCIKTEVAAPLLGDFFLLPFDAMPACATTRTTISAIRVNDHLFAVVPGEPETLFADRMREASPIEPDHTIVVGYAQDHVGYVMTAEDWLAQGYEPSINVWGPLEGEYIGERLIDLMPLAMTPARENAQDGFATRWNAPAADDTDLPAPDDAPQAGTLEDPPWERQYVRGGEPLASAQPAATIERLQSAVFAWVGEDPTDGTPRVILERETETDVWEPLLRRSGRVVEDQDVMIYHTPDPLIRDTPDEPRTHRWAAEWQAVTWWGSPADEVEDRFGVPLGRYRFRVEGEGYDLTSDPWEVVPATMTVDASASGGSFAGTASFHAPNGWRLLHRTMTSNEPVPANGTLTFTFGIPDSDPVDVDADTDASGAFTVAIPAGATSVEVRDRFGNVASATL